MKKIILMFFCLTPMSAWAAGLSWTAYEVKKCATWYFGVGAPDNFREAFLKKYKKMPERQGKDGWWTPIEAQDIAGNRHYAYCYFKEHTTVWCKPYGDRPFPLGKAVFKYKPTKLKNTHGRHVCIKNCKSSRVRYFFDHGWESEMYDHPVYNAERKAIKRCRKERGSTGK